MSFTCYLTLATFTGVVSFEISSCFHIQHQKTEISPNKNGFNTDISFLSEERRGFEQVTSYGLLLYACLGFNILLPQIIKSTSNSFFMSAEQALLLKDPLFIHMRALLI